MTIRALLLSLALVPAVGAPLFVTSACASGASERDDDDPDDDDDDDDDDDGGDAGTQNPTDAGPGHDAGPPPPDGGTQPQPDAGQGGGTSTDPRSAANIFFIGHSLVNHDMPAMLTSLAQHAGLDHEGAVQVINGAPLIWQWNNSHTAEGLDARVELPTGHWDTLVLTEAIPLADQIQWNSSSQYAGNFHALALSGNPNAQTYMYETWHSTNTPNWRERLQSDLPLWESIVDEVNAAHDGRDMLLVPAGQALGRLVDAIAAGTVPGVSSRDALFSDDIHLSPLGNYFVACVQLATLYRRSPEGLSGQTTNRFGVAFPDVPAATAARLQQIAWEAVTAYPRSGVVVE